MNASFAIKLLVVAVVVAIAFGYALILARKNHG
jgi:hypothetical protein